MTSFKEDLEAISLLGTPLVLQSGDGTSLVALSAELQGRVMTSSLSGLDGASLGWVNRDYFRSGEMSSGFNPYGGEERFWIGPEGGQFSIFFAKGENFDLDHWQVPDCIDTDPYEVLEQSSVHVLFAHHSKIKNYSGFEFSLSIEREVALLNKSNIERLLGLPLSHSLKFTAYTSNNRLINSGIDAWKKETGLLSIWLLGMFVPGEKATVIIPINNQGQDFQQCINDSYFGKIPPDRLQLHDHGLFFKGDGKSRGKIGILPQYALPWLGSWDAQTEILTLLRCTLAPDANYVNSMWEIQSDPYAGDAINSYNDGPPEPGAAPLGPFYELESSSPAKELQPGEAVEHQQSTLHLRGDRAELNAICKALLHCDLAQVESAFCV